MPKGDDDGGEDDHGIKYTRDPKTGRLTGTFTVKGSDLMKPQD
jgi:hypothetical protein